jgi:Flp pilus assembly pilin Flp
VGNQDDRALTMERWRDAGGQAFTEYLMIVGLLAAIIIAVKTVVVPVLSLMVASLVRWIAVYLTSVPI